MPPPEPLVIAGLVPAAGASRRMGQDKRRLPFRGRTVLEVTVGSLHSGGMDPVVVVLEPDSPCRDLAGLAPGAPGRRVILAENPDPSRGMLSSIRAGLAAAQDLPGIGAVGLLPGDHPFVPPEAVAALVQEFARSRPLLLAPRYGARRGHPLLIARGLFAEAAACDDSVGLRQLVGRRRADLRELALDLPPAAEYDLDHPGDLERLGG